MSDASPAFWAQTAKEALADLGATADGLTSAQAAERLRRYGRNALAEKRRLGTTALLVAQFKSPIILILVAAAVLSAFLGDAVDSTIIIVIVLLSGLLTFWQERGAADAVARLLAVVEIKAQVLRDGAGTAVAHDDIVPGDVVLLSAGATVPADCLLLESADLFVDEATLTGESFPVDKEPGVLPADAALSKRTNSVFMGTHVISGTARVLVVRTGCSTEFGAVADRLALAAPETDFERGVRRFGYFLMEITLLLVIAIFATNVYLHKPVVDSLLFSLALAVGLTPQLLPAIISINLAHGARRMADRHVIVKRLDSIENFGSMDVLCSDKTGTLTQGVVTVSGAYDVLGGDSEDVALYAYLNSNFETGFTNPIDTAVRAARTFDVSHVTKLDEEPYDFTRKRLTILVEREGKPLMITKGALTSIIGVCTHARTPDGARVPIDEVRTDVDRLYHDLSSRGFRTLGVAIRDDLTVRSIDTTWEKEMTFVGVLALFDPPKEGATEAVERLRSLGVSLKIITGDNALVARTAGQQMGLEQPVVLTGGEMHALHERALVRRVSGVDIFAEIEPNQKEYLVRTLQKAGHVIGYLGDGINDASALHAADVGISVNSAVDVAKEAADIVLLEPGLDVLSQRGGGREGHVREHTQVRVHGHERQFWQHGLDGRSIAVPPLPAAAADPDPAHEPAHRRPRDDDRLRQCRPRTRRDPPALGHRVHPEVHARLRATVERVRLPDVRGPALRHEAAGVGAARSGDRPRTSAFPHRLVRGVGPLRIDGRTHHQDTAVGAAQPARSLARDRHGGRMGGHPRHPVHADRDALPVHAAAARVPRPHRDHPRALCERSGAGEAAVLPDPSR